MSSFPSFFLTMSISLLYFEDEEGGLQEAIGTAPTSNFVTQFSSVADRILSNSSSLPFSASSHPVSSLARVKRADSGFLFEMEIVDFVQNIKVENSVITPSWVGLCQIGKA